jgi:cellobiose-specific phosphotransferase system component IIA
MAEFQVDGWERQMNLKLVHASDDLLPDDAPRRTLVEVAAVAAELRRLIEECRHSPSAMDALTGADIAQAKALIAEARSRLARAGRSVA